ncbi:MAG: TIGR01244 family sulfur transferase, partial [Planktomarina sp.]
MKINIISPTYSVAPQIEATDMTAIAEAGYKSVICNRPDHENHPDAHMSVMAQSAADAGLTFAQHPFDSASFSSAVIDQQRQLLSELPGPILAYCATGTRCSIVWAFMQAGHQPV